MKTIDLSCRRAAGDTIFLEVKVVLKTHKYCFLKTFLNGLGSQILNNNNRFYSKLCEFLSRRRYRKCIFQIRLYAQISNCSKLFKAQYTLLTGLSMK